MEEHYTGVEVFHVGNSMGKVWKVARYDSGGKDLGTEYEIELSYTGDRGLVVIPEQDLPDMIDALNQALDYARDRKDEYGSDVPVPPAHHAAV